MTPHERLDAELDKRRVELDLTWAEVAAGARIHEVTLRAIRRGVNKPNARTKKRLEDTVGWKHGSIDAIFGGGEAEVIEQMLSRRPKRHTSGKESVHAPLVDRMRDNPEFMRAWERLRPEERKALIDRLDELDSRVEDDLVTYARALARPRGETAT